MRMKPARPSRRKFLGSVAGGAALTGVNSVLGRLAQAAPGASSLSGVEHVVIFMQENRSFDHYLGTLSGVRGYADQRALERKPGASVFGQPSGGKLVYPYRLDNSATSGQCVGDVAHDWGSGLAATNGGRMDGWVPAKGPSSMSYHTRADIPYMYALADAFTLCDAYFCSVNGPTNPNRLYLMTGMIDPGGRHGGPVTDNDEPGFSWTTYPERGGAALAGNTTGATAGDASGGSGGNATNTAGSAGALGGAAPEPFQTDNLLLNGDAENAENAWLASNAGTAIKTQKYGAATFPAASDVGPVNRGASFFYGGQGAAADSHQLVDVSGFASQIAVGARFSLSAHLGGAAGQDDRASVVLQLLAADGSSLGTETLGGPYAAERVGTTALLANKLDGKLPSATRSIDVHLVAIRASGTDDDGYADNPILMLHN